jgi:hypothetical protein
VLYATSELRITAMPAPDLVIQTVYAELRERCMADAFAAAFAESGSFVSKKVRGKNYWYFQEPAGKGRAQKYVGPETPELLEHIAAHRQARDDLSERRALVSTLVRSFGLPRPAAQIGAVLGALSNAGIFRLRAVLVGTIAYQTYSAMLGIRLPSAALQTGDIDIAQFSNVSVAIGEKAQPPLEILKAVDSSFRDVPSQGDSRKSTAYIAKAGLRVEFLTPNLGADSSKPKTLAALQTAAEPLRFLDFLIHEPEQAVILHDTGILVAVPQPERYAVHKLIVSQRRSAGSAKREKDIRQAQILLDILVQRHPDALRRIWDEAFARGRAWREHVLAGLAQTATPVREAVLAAVGQRR